MKGEPAESDPVSGLGCHGFLLLDSWAEDPADFVIPELAEHFAT